MKPNDLKQLLSKVMDQLTPQSTMEDVYEQLALLSDIDLSEKQEKNDQVYSQNDVEKRSQEWLK